MGRRSRGVDKTHASRWVIHMRGKLEMQEALHWEDQPLEYLVLKVSRAYIQETCGR